MAITQQAIFCSLCWFNAKEPRNAVECCSYSPCQWQAAMIINQKKRNCCHFVGEGKNTGFIHSRQLEPKCKEVFCRELSESRAMAVNFVSNIAIVDRLLGRPFFPWLHNIDCRRPKKMSAALCMVQWREKCVAAESREGRALRHANRFAGPVPFLWQFWLNCFCCSLLV